MKKIYFKYISLIIMILIQGMFFVSSSKIDEKSYYDNAINVFNGDIKTINNVFNDLSNIKGLIVNNIEGTKNIKALVTIEGNKDVIIKAMKEIKGYIIKDYEVKYDNDNFNVKLNLEEYKFKRKL
ncbi:hypothetical protein [Clostridium sp.]|uniref:hypothetical protein n=1 Tax=Clostridium sp. TaxID=1506 RepID=UPI0026DC6645|nr:hypothetical protein [Clostridium sp.]MDO5039004.1 hypothetical protein [Clostridium sp.]